MLASPLPPSHLRLCRSTSSSDSWDSAMGKVGHGASLFGACLQTLTIDKHCDDNQSLPHSLPYFMMQLLKGDDRESSARVSSPSSFRPLLKVTSPIQNIVCIPSEWACTLQDFTGTGASLGFVCTPFCHATAQEGRQASVGGLQYSYGTNQPQTHLNLLSKLGWPLLCVTT